MIAASKAKPHRDEGDRDRRRRQGKLVGPPDLKVARTMVWHVEGKVTTSDAHYLVATAAGVEHFVERHEMGLFTDEEYRSAFTKAGLTAIHDSNGLTGRGIYIGTSAEF
jgi:hypothetical protein